MTVVFGGKSTIPTGNYQNIIPEFSVEANTLAEARDLWLQEMGVIHRMVGKDLAVNIGVTDSDPASTVKCVFTGTEVPFDAVTHKYGAGWLSGSTFAGNYTEEFAREIIAQKSAQKHGVNADDILDWWQLKADTASYWGSAIHAALETYGKYGRLAETVKGDRWLAIENYPAYIQDVVKQFFAGRENERAGYEMFVADGDRKLCGFIDRLVYDEATDSYFVEDFKSNYDLGKKAKILAPFKGVVEDTKLGAYWLQLSFYSHIISRAGKTVNKLTIHHWDGDCWRSYHHPVVDITISEVVR